MKLYYYMYIHLLCSAILMKVVKEKALDLPLELEDFSYRDISVITSHFAVRIFFWCVGDYLSYRALVIQPKLWKIFCLSHILYLMADMSEMDPRTGVPLEEKTGARHCIQQAVMDNKSFKETLIILLQYARPVPRARAKTYVVFSVKYLAPNVNIWVSNIILAVHFLVITDDCFMIVF